MKRPSDELDELYVGYLPAAPPRTGRFIRLVVPALVTGGVAIGALVAALQRPFDAGLFEFGYPRQVEGVVLDRPYAMLLEARPAGDDVAISLLVGPGKHGAAGDALGLAGARVRLRGTRIEGPQGRALELVPGSIETIERAGATTADAVPLGRVALTGEIVDSKCYLGVMKPGRGKPHRSCAARCLSGGIPPLLLVEAQDGERRALLLASEDGSAFPRAELLDLVGETVEVEGVAEQLADALVLRVDRGGLKRRGR